MAAREERLSPATRNYVIFGLLFVVAVGLAIWDWLDPRERRGEADNALRMLIVTSSEHAPIAELVGLDGLNVAQLDPERAIAYGRELLDDDDAPAYRAAITYADEHGYGFVALDLFAASGDEHDPIDWALDDTPSPSTLYAVFSVGDVASEGPRMRSVELPSGITFDPRLAALDSIRLALYDHPDLTRLWTIEPNAVEAQARQVLSSRHIDERREQLTRDHAAWAELESAWPGHPGGVEAAVPHSLAGPWERVAAAPIPGGLLLEVRRVRAQVDGYRTLTLEPDASASFSFLPFAALDERADPNADLDADLDADLVAAREPCRGLPSEVTGEVAVAPDGSAVVIRQAAAQAELFVFEHDPGTDPGCRARRIDDLQLGDRAVGRAHASGGMAWNYDDDDLHWWDRSGGHRLEVAGVSASSGPWWIDATLLAMIGERNIAAISTAPSTDSTTGEGVSLDPVALGFEPVLILLSTTANAEGRYPRVELGTRELFGELLPDAPLLDLRPTGPRELVLVSERCPGDHADHPSPCLHRVSSSGAASLAELLPELRAAGRPIAELLTVEFLGSIPAHVELAVAPDGSRVAWIDRKQRQLWAADLRGVDRIVPRRLDADELPEASLRISADGRMVLSEIEIEITTPSLELGATVIARAFAP